MQPDFISDSVFNTFRDHTAKLDALIHAAENGADIAPELIAKHAEPIITDLQQIIEHYGFTALQRGSVSNKTNLERFFRNSTGTETPADPAIIAEMATARGQVLDE